MIATTATVVPTPLGGDNVVAARVSGFDNVVDYVFFHHAPINISAIIVMGIVHYFWQKHMDNTKEGREHAVLDIENEEKTPLDVPTWYALFPVMPLVLAIGFFMCFKSAKVVLVEVTLFPFALPFIAELLRMKGMLTCSKDVNVFFKGMGDGFSKVVILIVAAFTMVVELKIDTISNALNNM